MKIKKEFTISKLFYLSVEPNPPVRVPSALSSSIIKYLDILNEREKEIIIKRYGLFNNDELTQKEISSSMRISRCYVSRIEKRALLKIYKKFLKEKKEYWIKL